MWQRNNHIQNRFARLNCCINSLIQQAGDRVNRQPKILAMRMSNRALDTAGADQESGGNEQQCRRCRLRDGRRVRKHPVVNFRSVVSRQHSEVATGCTFVSGGSSSNAITGSRGFCDRIARCSLSRTSLVVRSSGLCAVLGSCTSSLRIACRIPEDSSSFSEAGKPFDSDGHRRTMSSILGSTR